jgi:hypothetical protein
MKINKAIVIYLLAAVMAIVIPVVAHAEWLEAREEVSKKVLVSNECWTMNQKDHESENNHLKCFVEKMFAEQGVQIRDSRGQCEIQGSTHIKTAWAVGSNNTMIHFMQIEEWTAVGLTRQNVIRAYIWIEN